MPTDFEIRQAFADDAPGMARTIVESFLKAHKGQMPDHLWQKRRDEWTYEVSEKSWRRSIADLEAGKEPDSSYFVATIAGEVIGTAATGATDDTTMELGALYIAPGDQRLGVGRALVDAVLARYADSAFTTLAIGVLAANLPARAFYERIGAQLIGEREKDEEGEMLPEVVYALPIVSSDNS